MHYASMSGQVGIVDYLMSRGARVGVTMDTEVLSW